MADYTTTDGQLAAIEEEVSTLSRDLTPAETRELFRAWLWLSQSAEGLPIRRYFARRLAKWADGPYDEGARRFILGIFEQMVEARKMQYTRH